MSTTTTTTSDRLNGVDVPTLFATIDAVAAAPAAAAFRFRATNEWLGGTHSRSTVDGFYGTGQELGRTVPHTIDADHPEVLVGDDLGPTPVEGLLHSLAACLTAGIGNIAAARGIRLSEVSSTVEGDIDLRGLLGLDDGIRNGCSAIRVTFRVRGDADADALRAVVEQSRARSAVFDMVTNGVPVELDVTTG